MKWFKFGPDYIIPKPFDRGCWCGRHRQWREAAMKSGVAQEPIDIEEYRERLWWRVQEIAAHDTAHHNFVHAD